MAQMIPVEPMPGMPMSEKTVHEALATLDREWTVLHSVQWQSLRNGRQGDGEADFVILNPRRGILVVEVKGGDIKVEEGIWTTTNSKTGITSPIKNPFLQATESKHALLSYLTDHGLPMNSISMMHAVAFPRRTVNADELGPAAPPEIVWDRIALEDISRSVERTCGHWGGRALMAPEDLKKIVKLLAPTTQVRRRLVDEVGETSQDLLRLTDEQIQDFRALKEFRRAVVLGGAGTGKTVLAVARARLLAENGFEPLLICYNELLGRRLAAEVSDDQRIWAGTFHALCFRAARAAGLGTPRSPSPEWWKNDAPQLLVEACAAGAIGHRSIVIDEGQDFPPEWLQALELIVTDVQDPPFYIFADTHQQLYHGGWRCPENMPPAVSLTVNCRSTTQIAQRAAGVFGEKSIGRGTTGPIPQFREVANRREALRGIQRLAETIVEREGVAADQVTVLSDDPALLEGLTNVSAGSVPFVRSGSGIRLETIKRFKGLECQVVILALTGQLDQATLLATAYTGISRAMSALYVFGPSEVRRSIGWQAA